MFIAKDLTHFKKLFVSKLKTILSDDELGAYILVLANSLQDDYLKNELHTDLKNNFNTLKEKYLAYLFGNQGWKATGLSCLI